MSSTATIRKVRRMPLLGPAVGIEPTSAKGFLAALPLNYTGPRTLCDSLASCNQNLSRASEFRDHSWMFRLRRTTCCPVWSRR